MQEFIQLKDHLKCVSFVVSGLSVGESLLVSSTKTKTRNLEHPKLNVLLQTGPRALWDIHVNGALSIYVLESKNKTYSN